MDESSKGYIVDQLRRAYWRATAADNTEVAADIDTLIAKVRGRGLREELDLMTARINERWLFDYHTGAALRPATPGEERYWDDLITKTLSKWLLVDVDGNPRAVRVDRLPQAAEVRS